MDEDRLKWLGAVLPLVTLFEAELRRQQQASGKTREQVLEEARSTWQQAEREADELADLRRPSDRG